MEEDVPYERVEIYRTARIDRVIKRVKADWLSF